MKRKILLAEDEELIADLYKLHLEKKQDVQVAIARNGKEVLEALKKEKFDLILLDLLMPVMGGYEVLTHLKKDRIRIPVTVVLTNLSEDLTKETCRALGAEDFIVKSETDAPDLWSKIEKYLPVE